MVRTGDTPAGQRLRRRRYLLPGGSAATSTPAAFSATKRPPSPRTRHFRGRRQHFALCATAPGWIARNPRLSRALDIQCLPKPFAASETLRASDSPGDQAGAAIWARWDEWACGLYLRALK